MSNKKREYIKIKKKLKKIVKNDNKFTSEVINLTLINISKKYYRLRAEYRYFKRYRNKDLTGKMWVERYKNNKAYKFKNKEVSYGIIGISKRSV